jgi:glycosyltransferase involved in cell wall biosynthesis
MKRILILYRELAGYFLACLDELCMTYDIHADIVAYPINKDAPFQLKHSQRVSITFRSDYDRNSLKEKIKQGDYALIFVSGWFDKDYLFALSARRCPAIIGFDNPWRGSLKHYIAAVYGRVLIKPKFDFAFVPGSKQKTFARYLGFPASKIITGVYSCDVPKFSSIQRTGAQPKRLIYVGRYAPEKFIPQLFEAFLAVNASLLEPWELHCVGVGPLYENRMINPQIHHHGFMQPDELMAFMAVGNAFILPSLYEPWGLVVHEFAAAGYPMIISDAVCAAEAFLKPGFNGYLFKAGNKESLKIALSELLLNSEEELLLMGERSKSLAQSITPSSWAKSIHALMA